MKNYQCEEQILSSISNGELMSIGLRHSGKFLNELGDYQECQKQNFTYTLEFLKDDKIFPPIGAVYAKGNCIPSKCEGKQVKDVYEVLYQTPIVDEENTTITYSVPSKDYEELDNQIPGFYIMIGFTILFLIFGMLGILVQHTDFGNLSEKKKIHQEETEVKNRKHYKKYRELLKKNDRFLLNKKKVWATFFLSFSIARNSLVLFYDMDLKQKVGFMKILKVLAFFWLCFTYTYYWAFSTYPINFNDYPVLISNTLSVILLSGILFAYDIWLFYTAFQAMNSRLEMIYIKKVQFNPIYYIIKTYLQYALPMCIIMAIMTSIYPFLGSGPIFPHFTKEQFVENCNKYWYTNILFISNFYPDDPSLKCGPYLQFLSTEFQLLITLIPLFLILHKMTYWKVQVTVWILIALIASTIPTLFTTIKYDVNAIPGFLNQGYNLLYNRLWFRVLPFLFGIAVGILRFEAKYSSVMNSQESIQYKKLFEKVKSSSLLQWTLQIIGSVLTLFSILILLADSACLTEKDINDQLKHKINYCWGMVSDSLYNTLIQYIFLTGITLILLPAMIGVPSKLKYIMSSHLWHVFEELTLSAYLLSYLIIAWFFTSRQTNFLISQFGLILISIAACMASLLAAFPFYILFEKPFKNFLDLILFPRRGIFVKKKDLDDDTDDESENDKTPDTSPTLTAISQDKNSMKDKFTLDTQNEKRYCVTCYKTDLQKNCKCICVDNKEKCICINYQEEEDKIQLSFDHKRSPLQNQILETIEERYSEENVMNQQQRYRKAKKKVSFNLDRI